MSYTTFIRSAQCTIHFHEVSHIFIRCPILILGFHTFFFAVSLHTFFGCPILLLGFHTFFFAVSLHTFFGCPNLLLGFHSFFCGVISYIYFPLRRPIQFEESFCPVFDLPHPHAHSTRRLLPQPSDFFPI